MEQTPMTLKTSTLSTLLARRDRRDYGLAVVFGWAPVQFVRLLIGA